MKVIGTASIIATTGDPMDAPQNGGVGAQSPRPVPARRAMCAHAGPRYCMCGFVRRAFSMVD